MRSRINRDIEEIFPCYYKAYDENRNVIYETKRKYNINCFILTNSERFSEIVFSYEKNGPEYHYYGQMSRKNM